MTSGYRNRFDSAPQPPVVARMRSPQIREDHKRPIRRDTTTTMPMKVPNTAHMTTHGRTGSISGTLRPSPWAAKEKAAIGRRSAARGREIAECLQVTTIPVCSRLAILKPFPSRSPLQRYR